MAASRATVLAGFLKYAGLDVRRIIRGYIANRIIAQKFVYFGKTF